MSCFALVLGICSFPAFGARSCTQGRLISSRARVLASESGCLFFLVRFKHFYGPDKCSLPTMYILDTYPWIFDEKSLHFQVFPQDGSVRQSTDTLVMCRSRTSRFTAPLESKEAVRRVSSLSSFYYYILET